VLLSYVEGLGKSVAAVAPCAMMAEALLPQHGKNSDDDNGWKLASFSR